MEKKHASVVNSAEPQYEPPAIEAVLTAEELEREVLYAGTQSPV